MNNVTSTNRAAWRARLRIPPAPTHYRGLSVDQLAFEVRGLLEVHAEHGGFYLDHHLTAIEEAMLSRPASPGEPLPDDARAVLGSVFGAMQIGKALRYEMVQSRPPARLRAALDAATAAGYLLFRPGPGPAVEWRLLRPVTEHVEWASKNKSKLKGIRLDEDIT